MPSNFENIKDSGRACVGCGRTSDVVPLRKLRTYSLSLSCAECYTKVANLLCANKNAIGVACRHEPHLKGPCEVHGCGCESWIHGLENEMDRQLAAGVGAVKRFIECKSFGSQMGKCGRVVFMKSNGVQPRLCEDCEKRWVQETKEGMKQYQQLADLDTKIEFPN